MKLYHYSTGFPKGTSKAIERIYAALSPLVMGGVHYSERRDEKGLPSFVRADWVRGAKLVELQVRGDSVSRVVVRGEAGARDLTVVIDVVEGCMVTGWYNRRGDWHRLTGERSERYIKVRR